MTWQYVYRLTVIKARSVRTVVRAIYQPRIELPAAKFPTNNLKKIATPAEIEAYQTIFASDLASNWDRAARPKVAPEKCNLKSISW